MLRNLSLRSCSLCELSLDALRGCRLRDISLIDCGLLDVPLELREVAGTRLRSFLQVTECRVSCSCALQPSSGQAPGSLPPTLAARSQCRTMNVSQVPADTALIFW